MKDYQKILLFLYPKLERLTRCAGEVIEARAVASGADPGTERCIEKILALIGFRNALLFLSDKMDRIFSALSREERYLLEYKYFRRRSMLEGEFGDLSLSCSERTYFRRQARLSCKLGGMFVRCGLDEEWFAEALGGYPYIRGAMERMRDCGERAFADKRAKCALAREGRKGA